MSDLGKAYVQIIPKADGITEKLKSTIAPGAGSAGTAAGSTFAANFKKFIVGAGIGTAVVGGLKAALDEGGKLQQSYGGLDTIYGEAAQAAKAYAVEAAKAGISANSYAEQAVSFAAGLKAAFGGDTAKAAEAANVAILDMADNAAKMGTPLENIQNAYQGFAKQNYTMLDNLKLGYGGTKKEMERLLSDATKISGVKYDMNNLGDVYNAIHVIQGELGLTGVAADEASNTFSGSMGAMKAAAANFLGSLTTGGDVEGAITTLITSTGTFLFKNLVPMVGNLITTLPKALVTAFIAGKAALMEQAPGIVDGLTETVKAKIPELLARGQEIVNAIRDGVIQYAPILWENAQAVISDYAARFTEAVPMMINKGAEFIVGLSNGIIANLPALAENAVSIITTIGDYLATNIPILSARIAEFMSTFGATIVNNIPTIIGAILRALPVVVSAIQNICWAVIQYIISVLPTVANLGFQAISGLASGMGGAALGLVKAAMQKIRQAMEEPIQKARDTLQSIVDKIKGFFPISIGRIFSNLKLPHISVDGGEAPFGIGGKGSLPSFGVEWYARGGIVNQAKIIGVGEAGPEAIIPLSGNRMKPFTDAVAAAEARNNEMLINGMYRAFSAALNDANMTISINNREFGRILREAGAL